MILALITFKLSSGLNIFYDVDKAKKTITVVLILNLIILTTISIICGILLYYKCSEEKKVLHNGKLVSINCFQFI